MVNSIYIFRHHLLLTLTLNQGSAGYRRGLRRTTSETLRCTTSLCVCRLVRPGLSWHTKLPGNCLWTASVCCVCDVLRGQIWIDLDMIDRYPSHFSYLTSIYKTRATLKSAIHSLFLFIQSRYNWFSFPPSHSENTKSSVGLGLDIVITVLWVICLGLSEEIGHINSHQGLLCHCCQVDKLRTQQTHFATSTLLNQLLSSTHHC